MTRLRQLTQLEGAVGKRFLRFHHPDEFFMQLLHPLRGQAGALVFFRLAGFSSGGENLGLPQSEIAHGIDKNRGKNRHRQVKYRRDFQGLENLNRQAESPERQGEEGDGPEPGQVDFFQR